MAERSRRRTARHRALLVALLRAVQAFAATAHARGILYAAAAIYLAGFLPSTAPEPVATVTMPFPFPVEPDIAVQLEVLPEDGTPLRLDEQALVLIRKGTRRELPATSVALSRRGDALFFDGLELGPDDAIAPMPGADLRFKGRSYPGRFHLRSDRRTGALVAVVPIEAYLEGVIAAEMGASQHLAALEAQAVAARSFALRRILRRPNAPWHLDTTQRTQVWHGWPPRRDRTFAAVNATRGIVLSYDDAILDALYSSTCGGATRAAGEAFGGKTLPPLSGVPCGHCEGAPLFRWTAKVPMQKLAAEAGLAADLAAAPELERTPSGRMTGLTLVDRRGRRATLDDQRVRRLVGERLRSRWIESVRIDGADLVFRGRGFGHGVGLCQYGARFMARGGASAQSILEHYYPTAALAFAWPPRS